MKNLIKEFRALAGNRPFYKLGCELPYNGFLEVLIQVDNDGIKVSGDFLELEMYSEGMVYVVEEQGVEVFLLKSADLSDCNAADVLDIVSDIIYERYKF